MDQFHSLFLFIDKPIQPKKAKFEEAAKLKKAISKSVYKAMENEMRARALDKPNLSRTQQAVAEHNKSVKKS